MRVSVYFNLHRKLFSVRAEEGPEKGRVIAHAERVGLHFCTLTVGQAGNAKVRREGRKNVHAFIRGDLTYLIGTRTEAGIRHCESTGKALASGSNEGFEAFHFNIKSSGAAVTYNPYTDTTFVLPNRGRAPITSAACVAMCLKRGVYAKGF